MAILRFVLVPIIVILFVNNFIEENYIYMFIALTLAHWDWAIQTIPEIQKHTDRKIVIRPHKMFIRSNDNQKINEVNKRFKNIEIRPYENESIFDVLKNTWATVIFSTTAGLPSLIEGVPLFVTSETSMLYEMSSGNLSQIENPKLQDRLPFLIKNSNRHWTQKEIQEGTYWNTIREYL